jgi:phospholipid/cholesterol/gamma-HCH transport system permease protein
MLGNGISAKAVIRARINFFKTIVSSIKGLGDAAAMTAKTFKYIIKWEISIKNTADQMVQVGWASTFIVALASFFTGMVLALQVGSSTINLFGEPLYVGTITSFSLVIELGPVLTAIIVAGRVGAAITAEVGTMKVTEQIDALHTLGTNSIKYLAVPRFLACILMLPVLTAIANIIGVFGGMVLATSSFGVSSTAYWQQALDFMIVRTFFHGFIKSFFFALIISVISCHKGFKTNGGAEGVGRSVTSSVMTSLITILVLDYFLTSILVTLKIK